MSEILIKAASVEEFFWRGRQLARAADRGQYLAKEYLLSFEDAAEMTEALSLASSSGQALVPAASITVK